MATHGNKCVAAGGAIRAWRGSQVPGVATKRRPSVVALRQGLLQVRHVRAGRRKMVSGDVVEIRTTPARSSHLFGAESTPAMR